MKEQETIGCGTKTIEMAISVKECPKCVQAKTGTNPFACLGGNYRVVHKCWPQPDAEDIGISCHSSRKYSDTTLIFFK
jgi:hypothetical protein